MASIWISYVLLGISLSAPVGPVNVAQIKAGLSNGFWNAWFVGIGAMCADLVFMLLIYFGAAAYLTDTAGEAAHLDIGLCRPYAARIREHPRRPQRDRYQ